jgi:peptidyl-Lys metalloendopeptidase
MRQRLALVLSLCLSAAPVAAETYPGCSAEETRVIAQALRSAKDLTLKAAAQVGDTADYQRWFGEYTPARAEEVRESLKAIVTAIRGGGVTARCERVVDGGCNAGEYAWVYSDEPYLMHICPQFFTLPVLQTLEPGTRRSEYGTREGTIVHELSHFLRVAGTEDHCYSRAECSRMARNDTRRAIENADSYQYFTEDVTYYARQPIGDKPPPAPAPRR